MYRNFTQQGFSLLEAVIYIGLFTLVIGGAIVSTYYVFESNSRLQAKVYAQQEGGFILSKFNWVLSGSAVTSLNASPLELSVVRSGHTYTIGYAAGSKAVTLSRDGGGAVVLNNDAAPVSNFQLVRLVNADEPDKVKLSFSIDNLEFASEKYVRE